MRAKGLLGSALFPLPELSSHLLFFQTLEPNTPQKGKESSKKKKKQFGKKRKRIPSAKARPLRQGSKKPFLEENLQALGVSEPVPDDSKTGLSQGLHSQLWTLCSSTWTKKNRVEFEGDSPGTKQF